MTVQIGVEVIDEQCAKCPRLKVSSEELYNNGNVIHNYCKYGYRWECTREKGAVDCKPMAQREIH